MDYDDPSTRAALIWEARRESPIGCPHCYGSGKQYVERGSSLCYACPDCGGTGHLCDDDEDNYDEPQELLAPRRVTTPLRHLSAETLAECKAAATKP
jgi:hypothetical protein